MTVSDNQNNSILSLFPLYASYKDMVTKEVAGLTDAQLDWTSNRWSWSRWSIRNNVSHVASHLFRWYILRWKGTLFPYGPPITNEEAHYLAGLPHRQLDHNRWWNIDHILAKLDQGLEMVRDIISRETAESLKEKSITLREPGFYLQIADRYPGTLLQDPNEPSIWLLTLEGNLHHSEGEMITHLYNVQRIKNAQGLKEQVPLPQIGYWTLPSWDRSEA